MKPAKDILSRAINAASLENTPTSSSASHDPDAPCTICGGKDLCGNLGVIRYNVPVGDPRFGKLFRCPHNAVDLDIERQERLRKLSNLGAFVDKTFENFVTEGAMFAPRASQSLKMAYDMAVKFAENPTGWLLLEGTYGCGKTHLAAAIANVRLKHGDPVLFITSPDLLDHLRGAYAPESESTYDELFDRVRNTPLLILDDLGVENPSPWAQEKLFQLLNHRYNHNFPTIITTNAHIDKLDARVRSRLLDSARTHRARIAAPDYRVQFENELTQLVTMLPLYEHMTFETFDYQTNLSQEEAGNLLKAIQIAMRYAQAPEGWLLIAGSYGTGKTHLAAAIANACNQRSAVGDVVFITTAELIDYLKTTFSSDAEVSFEQRLQQLKNVPLLVLDDLGGEVGSAWAREKLFQLIDYRYVTRKPTVFTTARDIEKLDERLRTRLFDKRLCRMFEIFARSYVARQR